MTARFTRVVLAAGTVVAAVAGGGFALASVSGPATAKPKFECIKIGHAASHYFEHGKKAPWACRKGFVLVGIGARGATGARGARGATGAAGPSGVLSTHTTAFGPIASVATGGSFVNGATQVGTIALEQGTYLLSLNAKATPDVSSAVEVFPQFFVYNQVKNGNFAGDLFNVGSGSLATSNTVIDSYFSGSTVLKLSKDTTLYIYAFGYDSDRGAGSYTLDDLSVTATKINPAP